MRVDVMFDDRSLMVFLNNASSNLPALTDAAVKGIATRYKNRLIKVIRAKHTGTGYLARSIKRRKLSHMDYAVTAPRYIRPLEEGSIPHAMPVGGSRWRVWADRKGLNKSKFYWHVYHHGTEAHPFTLETLIRTRSEWQKDLKDRTQNFLRTKGKSTGGP